jgi:hypothetical protein
VRSESSFDESQSVLYPDQIVPPGMYDMRESYRSAIVRGRKSPGKPKPQKKDLAHGLMALSVEAFSMPVESNEVNSSNTKAPKSDQVISGVNSNAADTKTSPSKNGTQSSLDIDIYPYEGTRVTRDNGVINESFVKNQEDIARTKVPKSGSHVCFADTNGIVNEGLLPDEKEEQDDLEHYLQLSIPIDKERSNSDVTPFLFKNKDNISSNRRSSLT